MPLESIPRLLAGCREGGYAVGYFGSWNLEPLQGVLEADWAVMQCRTEHGSTRILND